MSELKPPETTTRTQDHPADRDRPIVVGVDGSPASIQALRWAMGQAHATGVPIEAVTAWQDPVVYGASYRWTTVQSEDSLETIAERALTARMARARADIRQPVTVLTRVINGDPTQVLLDAGARAAFLVVGSHGHGALAGALLGSISQHLCQRAPCPVVVVPSPGR